MDFNDVYQVASVTDDEAANKLLSHGWKLLKVTVNASADERYLERGVFQISTPVYILGASKDVAGTYSKAEATKRSY